MTLCTSQQQQELLHSSLVWLEENNFSRAQGIKNGIKGVAVQKW